MLLALALQVVVARGLSIGVARLALGGPLADAQKGTALLDKSSVSALLIAPHSIDAEQSVLGGLLIDNGAFDKVRDVVTDGDFYRDDHRRIFRHVSRLIERGKPADVVTVDESIKASEDRDKTGGMNYLAALAGNTPSAHNVRRYAEIVAEKARLRDLQAIGNELHDRAGGPGADPAALRREVETKLLAIEGSGPEDWPILDLVALAEVDPQPPQFILSDWLPVGYASLLAGHGGVGKSALALYLAVCIVAGVSFFGAEVARRRVLFLSCEDRESVLHWRLARICAHLGIDLGNLRGWLEVIDLVGKDSILWERDPRTGYTITPSYATLCQRVKAHDTELLVVDGISDTFAGNENSRAEVKRFINSLVALIPADRGAVLLVGHVAKPTAANSSTTEGYSGSTAWHNAVRARWYLRLEKSDEDDEGTRSGGLVLDLQKSNFGRINQSLQLAWDKDAHLLLGQMHAETRFDRQHQDRTERAGILRALKGCADAGIVVPVAMQGPRTAYLVLSLRPEFPDSLKGSGGGKKQRFRRHLEELRQIRHIAEGEYRRSNRHTVASFVLTTEGRAECA
jgi:hypothetical protein